MTEERPLLPPALIFLIAAGQGSTFDGTAPTNGYHPAWMAISTYDAAIWIRDNAPEATVGSWNAGIMSYFSRAEVVNLDGVINDEALAANRTRSIDAYIRARGIDFLADGQGQIESNLNRFAGETDLIGDIQVNFNDVVVAAVR